MYFRGIKKIINNYKYRSVPWLLVNWRKRVVRNVGKLEQDSHDNNTEAYLSKIEEFSTLLYLNQTGNKVTVDSNIVTHNDITGNNRHEINNTSTSDRNGNSDILSYIKHENNKTVGDSDTENIEISPHNRNTSTHHHHHHHKSNKGGRQLMRDCFGFSIVTGESTIEEAGTGVFVDQGCIPKSSLVAFYPGTVYYPMDPIFFQSVGNPFILRCVDGVMIDGNNRSLSARIYRSCAHRDQMGSFFTCDMSWLLSNCNTESKILDKNRNTENINVSSIDKNRMISNPMAVGQYVNNETRSHPANVTYQELDIPVSFPYKLMQFIPNINYRPTERDVDGCFVRTVVLIALRDIKEGEELFSSYFAEMEKTALLHSAREERRKRELSRKQNNASVKIQSWFRGCVVRRAVANSYRQIFDATIKQMEVGKVDAAGVDCACGLISLFYKLSEDYHRLVVICQMLLKLNSSQKLTIITTKQPQVFVEKLKRLLCLCSKSLRCPPPTNISISLRMLEVFTTKRSFYWIENKTELNKVVNEVNEHLVMNGYFSDLKTLLTLRVPNTLEPSAHPPTPIAGAVKDMFVRPLEAAFSSSTRNGESVICKRFIEILSSPMDEQVCFYLLPALSSALEFGTLIRHVDVSDNAGSTRSVWLLYSLVVLYNAQTETMSTSDVLRFVHVLRSLMVTWTNKEVRKTALNSPDSDSDSDDEAMEVVTETSNAKEQSDGVCLSYVKRYLLDWINSGTLVTPVLSVLNKSKDSAPPEFAENVCAIAYHLATTLGFQVHRTKFLYSLAYSKSFLRVTWHHLTSLTTTATGTGKPTPLLQLISYGRAMTSSDQERVIPMLGTFTLLFRYALFSIYDSDFYKTSSDSSMPFTIAEVIEMSSTLRNVILGLIIFMYPDIRMFQNAHQRQWYTLCQVVTQLVKQLYARDCRHRFCPEQHWLSSRAAINHDSVQISSFLKEDENGGAEVESGEGSSVAGLENQPQMSTLNLRNLATLKFVPFAVPFMQRVKIFQKILYEDKIERQRQLSHMEPNFFSDTEFDNSGSVNISVNRQYLYQEAYDQLAKENCPDIKKLIRVRMKNVQGLDEAGIDGGGVFREFISQLVKSAFDPSYAFFKCTSQQLLYPNPDIGLIQPDYLKHMHFLGRVLGKLIYESMMVELPLADFFLCKLLNRHGADVDIHYLESLDPDMHKNLFDLKNYKGDADDLSLNFTVVQSCYGETKVEELKPGGKDICVDNSNKIEYIHLMADFKLNKQIRSHCNAFRAGLSDVINIEWLQMFSHNELQVLISGARVEIRIEDLRANTNYSGLYTANDPYMQEFWSILSSFTDTQKQQFLKFVTSCSRPPLLGFVELYPKFCIHYGGEEDRLPTASTCMNFLKLPKYSSKELLRKRLLYAIEAEAGFELS